MGLSRKSLSKLNNRIVVYHAVADTVFGDRPHGVKATVGAGALSDLFAPFAASQRVVNAILALGVDEQAQGLSFGHSNENLW